jgi:hypothetical protein
LIDRRFRYKGSVGQTEIIEQAAERFLPDGSLSDVLMAVEFRAARGLGIIAVPHFDPI